MSAIILDYYKQLKNNFQFDFVINEFIESHFLNQLDEKTHIYKLSNRKRRLFEYIVKLRNIIKENKYDIIHIHGNSSLMAIELFACSHSKSKMIVHCHGTQSDYGFLEKLTRNYFFRHYHQAITVELEKSYLFAEKEHTVLLNGIDVNKYKFSLENRLQIRQSLKIENNTVLLHVGRMNRSKNHLFLLNVFSDYLSMDPTALLILIGDGPLKNEVVDEIRKLDIENQVKLIGLVENTSDWYSAADIFLLPSNFESFGLVAVEAQVNGLPCIFSENVSKKVKISERVTYLETNNTFKWIETILDYSKKKRPQFFNQVAEDYLKYDISASANKLKEIYLRLIEENLNEN